MHLTVNNSSQVEFVTEACDSYTWDGTTYTESGDYEQLYTTVMGCDSIVMMHLTINTAPILEAISGDVEVDVRLMPSSIYTTEANTTATPCVWSIEPEEAGVITGESTTATITWSDTYKGQAVIKVESDNSCGQDEKTMTVTVKNSTDVNEYSINALIYPNPTSDVINVEVEGLQRLTVTSILGQTVYDQEVEGDKAQIDMAQFGVGTYLIRIQSEHGVATKRVNVMQ